jgi:cellobiose-specific phosphotransferase system component IIC
MKTDKPSSESQLVKRHPLAQVDFQQLGGEHTNTLLAAVLTGLSLEILSSDVMALSLYRAAGIAVQNGVPPDVAKNFIQQLMPVMEAGRRRNPLSEMF